MSEITYAEGKSNSGKPAIGATLENNFIGKLHGFHIKCAGAGLDKTGAMINLHNGLQEMRDWIEQEIELIGNELF